MPPASGARKRPLSAFPAFAVSNFDQLSGILEAQLGARIARMPVDGSHIEAVANAKRLENSEFWYCAYGMPLSVKFPDGDYLRLQLRHRGVGGTWQNGKLAAVTPTQACISRAEVEIDFAPDFEQLVWRVPKGKLEQRLALMTGRPIAYALDFAPALDLTSPKGAMLQQIVNCLRQTIEAGTMPASQLVVRELEQALVSAFLATADHSGRSLLEAEPARVGAAQVSRAEAHIEANWDQPITIEDLVAATGSSARSLFRSFKETRGCSPMEFARDLRLQHARKMLENAESATTVTDVAFACGFGDLGRFAKEFQRAFGQRPSELLAGRRRRIRLA
jgi:AraC-like DNA-binding protein